MGETALLYIGQTQALARRLGDLQAAFRSEMPYNDPHTAAPCLWVLRTEQRVVFEVSVRVMAGPPRVRMAAECVEVALHRRRFGVSPFANFGRMPEGWVKSSQNNAGLAARGGVYRGYPDPSAHRVPDEPCVLDLDRDPTDARFAGLSWSPWSNQAPPPGAVGVYRLHTPGSDALRYIGQGRIAARLRQHGSKGGIIGRAAEAGWAEPWLHSWAALPGRHPKHLLEIENDLIASHTIQRGQAPDLQFMGINAELPS